MDADTFISRFLVAFSAMAAATREEWSVLSPRWPGIVGEFNRSDASGSFSLEDSDKFDKCNASLFNDELVLLHMQ